MINVPTVSSRYSLLSERSEPKIGWSGAVSGHCRKTMERSAEQEVAERERRGDGNYRNFDLSSPNLEIIFSHGRNEPP